MKFKAIKNLSQEIQAGQIFTVQTDEEAKIFRDNPLIFEDRTKIWPSVGDAFYYILPNLVISGGTWEDSIENQELMASGNCFQDRSQATLRSREIKELLT